MKKRNKSVGNTEQGQPIIVKSSGGGGVILPLVAVAGVGVLGYFGYKAYDKKREEKAINEANEKSLQHDLNIIKTKKNIDKIESKAFVTGVNSFSKKVTVNITTQVKEAINQFYFSTVDKNGITKYAKKAIKNVDQNKVREAFFNTPVLSVKHFASLYNIYTGKSFIDDAQKLNKPLYYQIKAIFEVAHKKGVKGLSGLTSSQKNLM